MFTFKLHIRTSLVATAGAIVLALVAASPASATDFCLDLSDPNCPAGSSFSSNLETAMVDGGGDGFADRVFVPAGTIPAAESFSPNGISLTDDLEVIGAGREQTILTSNSSSNVIVLDLNGIANREVTVRDLTIRVPASFPDSGGTGYGAAFQSDGDIFRRVNFESRNPANGSSGSAAASAIIGGGTFDDVRAFGSSGGGFGQVFTTGAFNEGDTLEISDGDFRDFRGGITYYGVAGIPVHIKGSHFRSEFGTVLGVYNADSSVENSVIEAGEFPPFQIGTLSATSAPSSLVARNNTILNMGGAETAFNVAPSNLGSGNASAVISDSIIFGFAKSWTATALAGAPGAGDANLEVTYSNFENPGTAAGDGVVNTSVGNISETPLFSDFTDFRLSPDSPSIDAGNPAAGGIADDIEGTVRPLDGDGDGTRVRDQGAFEAPEIPTCQTDPALCPAGDTTAPVVKKLRSKKVGKKSKTFKLTYRLSEAARVKLTFKPVPVRKKGKKRKTVRVSKLGKVGPNILRLKKRKLKPGRYRITVRPTDAAGNVGEPLAVKAVYLGGRKQRLNVQLN